MQQREQEDGVYQISTGAELYWFENEVNVNKKVDINAVLTADINLAGYSWTPIGTSGAIYMGSFDGQGHTISNLYQNDIGYSGIFGQAGARISSLTVEGTKNSDCKNIWLLPFCLQSDIGISERNIREREKVS